MTIHEFGHPSAIPSAEDNLAFTFDETYPRHNTRTAGAASNP